MDIWWNGNVVGTGEMKQEGLYLSILCRCRKVSSKICRIYAVSQRQRLLLGVLRPEGGMLFLSKRIANRQFPQGQVVFVLEDGSRRFYPLCPDAPFACMEDLRWGRFQQVGDIWGISISKETGQ